MDNATSDPVTMKVFQKGQVVIPVALRKKYGIEIGNHVEIIETPEGILIKAKPQKEGKKSLTQKLYGIVADVATARPSLKKDDITKATELGYIEGWKE
ncbi:MAG: hypothetical protein DRH12_16245 [Deltaproteobacteria bacterium]|nr:MAG: hypothetical protein DRH12_16245 [Deltaproteobacteria bacterium]